MVFEAFTESPTQRVRLSTGPINFRRIGSGPPMLLVHGWGGSSRHWYMTMADLADSRTIYALDLPGHGHSPPLAVPSSAERLSDVLLEFADTMEIDQFDLNGHSFGAAVAVYMAARYPQRVKRMIISSFGAPSSEMEQWFINQLYFLSYLPLQAMHPWLGLLQPWQTAAQLTMVGAGFWPLVPWTAAWPYFYKMPQDMQMIQEGFMEFVLMDPRTSLENTMSLGNPSLRTAMTQLQAPTLLVGGRQDMTVLPLYVESAARLIPNSRIAWIDGCGHVPMIEQPDTYKHILHDFLAIPEPLAFQPAA